MGYHLNFWIRALSFCIGPADAQREVSLSLEAVSRGLSPEIFGSTSKDMNKMPNNQQWQQSTAAGRGSASHTAASFAGGQASKGAADPSAARRRSALTASLSRLAADTRDSPTEYREPTLR